MRIANPMYDAAFKYLVEDNDCARCLLGEIIQQEILECELLHNEIASEAFPEAPSGVLKMDFKAVVKTREGRNLLIIIEVQKALKETNLLRFRQYLGAQYSNRDNCYMENQKKVPLPILSIYFLGYNVGLDNSIPVIKISPRSFDYTEGKELHASCQFTDCLSHEMIIIQTRVLKKSRRSLLERFLSNFMPEVQHFLEVNPGDFDRKYVSLLKRLEEATMKKEIVELMQRENLIQEEWNDMVRTVVEERRQKEEERRQKEEALLQKEEELKQKEELMRTSVLALHELGLGTEEIAMKLKLPVEKVESFITR